MIKVLALLFSVFLVAGGAWASDAPRPQDHEFNPNMPAHLLGHDETLRTADGTPFKAYVTGDPKARRGILLVHEWWGLNDHIRAWADRFARLGYRAVAVDLYNGKSTTDPKVAGQLMKSVDPAVADTKLKAALESLKAPGRKLATIGWCFGGGYSLRATLQDPAAVSATVIYYGQLITDQDKLKTLHGPVLGIFAEKDHWISPDKVAAFETAMVKAGKHVEVHSYWADHAFANPSGERYNSLAAREAWQVVKDFLNRNL